MTTLKVYRGSHQDEFADRSALTEADCELDMETIQNRVAGIKQGWSSETVRARAVEGARRRSELAALVSGLRLTPWERKEIEETGLCL